MIGDCVILTCVYELHLLLVHSFEEIVTCGIYNLFYEEFSECVGETLCVLVCIETHDIKLIKVGKRMGF